MANRRSRSSLPFDPNFLLELIDDIPEEPGSSDEEFDGCLGPDDGPVTFASNHSVEDYDSGTTLARSRSLDSLTELEREHRVTARPSPSTMAGQHASRQAVLHSLPAPPTPLKTLIYCNALCIYTIYLHSLLCLMGLQVLFLT